MFKIEKIVLDKVHQKKTICACDFIFNCFIAKSFYAVTHGRHYIIVGA